MIGFKELPVVDPAPFPTGLEQRYEDLGILPHEMSLYQRSLILSPLHLSDLEDENAVILAAL
jgi:hypothetical protein